MSTTSSPDPAAGPSSWRTVEPTLPRVPLPTLERSCALLLEWCAPLLSAEQYAATERAVAAFLAPGSPAHEWQRTLTGYDARPDVASWLDSFWPARYLGRRDRIALNANFFFLFFDDPQRRTQSGRAARLIADTLAYHHAEATDTLAARTLRGQPLSSAQTDYLFSATRIPGRQIDTSRSPHTSDWPGPSRERHIVVLHRDALWSLDVLDEHGRPYPEDAVAAALEAITTPTTAPGPGLGRLTTLARAEWADVRHRLATFDPANAELLDVVERALFCVCLDDTTPTDVHDAGNQLLYGNSGTRWYDKALSYVVFADAMAGVNVEHCNLDGTTVVALVEDVLTGVHPRQDPADGAPPPARPLVPVLDDDLRATIAAAGADFAGYGAAMASTVLDWDDFGSDAIKAVGVSPDAFVQLAYQLAHHRVAGALGATYESIAMRTYRHGRTEAMRVVTPQVLRFVSALADPQASSVERATAFRAAAEAHVARARQCQAGDAPEQHLWELQLIGRRAGDAEVELYDTPGWTLMRTDHLSTSSVPSHYIRSFGFGSTSPVCIGVGYVLLPGRLSIYLSTPRTVEVRMHEFARQLRATVDELLELARTSLP